MADYNNGSVTVTVTGGQSPYTYTLLKLVGSNYEIVPDNQYTSTNWQNPATVSSTEYTFGNPLGPDQNTTINETGIEPGTYKVRIVDKGECELETDPIEVGEFVVGGGSTACVTFETAPAGTPSATSWVLNVIQPTSTGAVGSISVGVPGSEFNGGFSNNFNSGEITGKVVHNNGTEYPFTTFSGSSGPSTIVTYSTGPILPAGSYTGFLEVPSEECSRNLGNITVVEYQAPTLDITGITFSSEGSTVSPSNLVVGTPYTVTINTNSANLIGAEEYLLNVNGTTSYIQVPTGYTNSNQFTVTINAAGTFSIFASVRDSGNVGTQDIESLTIIVAASGGGDPTFTCDDAGFNMPASTTDQIGQSSINYATVSQGTLQSVLPATIEAGDTTYTATIQIPEGYQNPGGTLTTCTDTSVGNTSGGGGGTGTTVYYFHGGATNVGWPHTVGGAMTGENVTYYTQSNTTGSATLSDAMTFVLDNYGDGTNAVPDFLGGGSGYFIRSVEFAAGTTLLNDGNAGTSTEITFDALDVSDYAYIAIPQVAGFTDDLAANPGNILYAGNALSGANAIQKKAFTWNGQEYMLFSINALSAFKSQQSITINN